MHKIRLRDRREEEYTHTIINGVLTRKTRAYDVRELTVELVPGEGGVPERIDYYSTGKTFIPERLSISWHRHPGEEWGQGTTEIAGQGFSKDGRALKGRSRRSDGSLAHRWPLAVDDHTRPMPAWMSWEWVRGMIDAHDPNKGWPQSVTEEAS